MPALPRLVKRGRDQNRLCGTAWTVTRKNARGVVTQRANHTCGRATGHTGQHVCRCGARKKNP